MGPHFLQEIKGEAIAENATADSELNELYGELSNSSFVAHQIETVQQERKCITHFDSSLKYFKPFAMFVHYPEHFYNRQSTSVVYL